jgi:hypothetical protein
LPSFTSRDRSDRWCHRSDRCWSVDSRFGVPLRSRVGKVCVLVPRSSGSPVATWAWPTWVVSRRRVLEVVFIMLEFPCHSRRIFIGSHSLPPLWFAVSVLHEPPQTSRAYSGCEPLPCTGSCPRLRLDLLATMRPALDPVGHRVPRAEPTCLSTPRRPRTA